MSYRIWETSITRVLRRPPSTHYAGYCQSLNFLAGMLLLFLGEDEEKAFILLNIITNTHLPGAHAKVLESNVDIGVLLSLIQESRPGVWSMMDDVDELGPGLRVGPSPGRGRSNATTPRERGCRPCRWC